MNIRLTCQTLLLCAASAAFAAPMPVSPEGQQAAAPDLAFNPRGEMALLWVDRSPQRRAAAGGDRHVAMTDVHVAVSTDGGSSFGAPVRVNPVTGSVWGQAISRPRIVGSASGTWHVTWAANEEHPLPRKTALTVHYARSTDGARSFEAPRRISTLTDQDLSGVIHGGFASAAAFGALAVAQDGRLHLLWIDTRHMKPDSDSAALYAVESVDDGKTFSGETQLIDTGVCPCCQLMAVPAARSGILLGSRRVTPDSFRPATVARLPTRKGGAVERIDVGGAPWQISGCPLKPTVVAAKGQRVFAAVHSGGEDTPGVLLSRSRDGGRTFESLGLEHPEAAVSDAPAIATNGRVVLVAWHGKTAGPRRIFYRFHDMDGAPRGAVQELDSGAGVAQYPVLAVRPDGDFQVAWQQADRIWTTSIAAR